MWWKFIEGLLPTKLVKKKEGLDKNGCITLSFFIQDLFIMVICLILPKIIVVGVRQNCELKPFWLHWRNEPKMYKKLWMLIQKSCYTLENFTYIYRKTNKILFHLHCQENCNLEFILRFKLILRFIVKFYAYFLTRISFPKVIY